jgi:hypothetical protein
MSYGSSETEYYHLLGPTPEKFSGVTSRPNLPVQQSNLINAEAG